MQPTTYGGGWYGSNKGLNPALLSALHLIRSYDGRHRYQHSAWILDFAVNFSRTFKRFEGVSPRDYLRALANAGAPPKAV